MSEDTVEQQEQICKVSNLETAAFMLFRGARLKDKALRADNRVDFFLAGLDVFTLLREYETEESAHAKAIKAYNHRLHDLRDAISQAKQAARK